MDNSKQPTTGQPLDIPLPAIHTSGYLQGVTTSFVPPPQHVVIDVNVNVKKPDELEVRDEIFDFAEMMEVELQQEEQKRDSCLHTVGIEELIRLAEEKLSGIKSAVELRLSPDTLISEAAAVANYVMSAVSVYAEDFSESD